MLNTFVPARRILIYLNERALKKLVEGIYEKLSDEGILVLGRGEVYFEILEKFEPLPFGEAIFWKKKKKEIPLEIERKMVEGSMSELSDIDKMDLIKDLINRGLYEEALIWIRSMKDHLSDSYLWKNEVVALEYMGKREEARKILEEALQVFPDDGDLLRLKKVIS
jgi:tetratricopeptide (TPR) repeat protein